MDLPHGFLLFCTLLACYNLGIVWFVQLVVYPLFGQVGAAEYVNYHKFYSSWIPIPVILPGFASFLLPIGLIFLHPNLIPSGLILANAAFCLLSLFVTVALEIPRHSQLETSGKQDDVIRELIFYNWPRTVGITGSACLSVMMLTLAFAPA